MAWLEKLKLGIIGCGTVAEKLHLPSIARCRDVQLTVVVDQNTERRRRLALRYNAPYEFEDYSDIGARAEAVIVALPNHLHAPVAIDLLRQGLHVLVEKTMALTVSDCDDMIEASVQNKAVLAVGMIRRFYRATHYVKTALTNALLGRLIDVSVNEGSVLSWNAATNYMFQKSSSGGGV